MKKGILLLFLIGGCLFPSCAQNKQDFEQLCKKYEESENVESFGMDGLGCLLASWFVGKEAGDVNTLIRKCSSFRILIGSGEESKSLCKDIQAFVRANKLEELIGINEDGSEVKIYVETKKETICQVFISVIDEEREVVFLQLKGKFDPSSIKKLVKSSGIASL